MHPCRIKVYLFLKKQTTKGHQTFDCYIIIYIRINIKVFKLWHRMLPILVIIRQKNQKQKYEAITIWHHNTQTPFYVWPLTSSDGCQQVAACIAHWDERYLTLPGNNRCVRRGSGHGVWVRVRVGVCGQPRWRWRGGCGRKMDWGRGVGSREGRGRRRRVVSLGKRWHGAGRGRGGASGTVKGSLGRGNERRRWRRSRRYEILSMLRLLTTEIQTEKIN